jgi:hypothetical protein
VRENPKTKAVEENPRFKPKDYMDWMREARET